MSDELSDNLKQAKSWIRILLNINNTPKGEHAHIMACASDFVNGGGDE